MKPYIDSYPVPARRRREHYSHYYAQRDAVEPEEDTTAPRPVLDGYECPLCGKGFQSDDTVVYAKAGTWNAPTHFFHRECLTEDKESLLEALDYDTDCDTGAWMEEHTT